MQSALADRSVLAEYVNPCCVMSGSSIRSMSSSSAYREEFSVFRPRFRTGVSSLCSACMAVMYSRRDASARISLSIS